MKNQNRTTQHKVFVVKERPRPYPQNSQQSMFRQVLVECGIEKGISRDELVDKMINCIPAAWKKIKRKGS